MASEILAKQRQVDQLTFTRHRMVHKVLNHICKHLDDQNLAIDHEWLKLVHNWLVVPYTLWPNDFKGLAEQICRQLDSIRKIDDDIIAILGYLKDLPSLEAQKIVAAVERDMKEGNYDYCLTDHAKEKYRRHELELLESWEWQEDWFGFCCRHNVEEHYDNYGMLRRTLVLERGMHPPDWKYVGGSKDENFDNEFTALCAKHSLYGVQNGKPLLLKLSVNPFAFGSMIVIPDYWSFDAKRDLKWSAVNALQKARAKRLRADKKENEVLYHARLRKMIEVNAKADAQNLTADERHDFCCKEMGVPLHADESTFRRWTRDAAKMVEEEAKKAAVKEKKRANG